MLMPLIPNKYSWLFATVTMLICVPLVIYASLGWKVGKTVTGKIPVLGHHPRLSLAVFTVIVMGCILLIPFALPLFFGNTDTFSGDIRIAADQQYFSPQISSAKGLRLEITNLSGREVLTSRRLWSADYGYFIRVVPTTSDVIILGNPALDDESRYIFWTYDANEAGRERKPVTINVRLYPLHENKEIASASLNLAWFNNDTVVVNRLQKILP